MGQESETLLASPIATNRLGATSDAADVSALALHIRGPYGKDICTI